MIRSDHVQPTLYPLLIALKIFQEESPVHKFKPKTSESSVMSKIDTIDDDDDFGDFAAPVGKN